VLPGLALWVPASQTSHAGASSVELNVPFGHAVHCRSWVAVHEAATYVPASQFAVQVRHCVPSKYSPAEQLPQVVEPGGAWVPSAHGMQPASVPNVSSGQAVHPAAAGPLNEPAGQAVQLGASGPSL
jgi:hypothetical protein